MYKKVTLTKHQNTCFGDLGHVPQVGHTWMALCQQLTGERLYLAEAHSLPAEIGSCGAYSLDAAEQGQEPYCPTSGR